MSMVTITTMVTTMGILTTSMITLVMARPAMITRAMALAMIIRIMTTQVAITTICKMRVSGASAGHSASWPRSRRWRRSAVCCPIRLRCSPKLRTCLQDCGSLILAVVAIRVNRRPARPDRTYGHRRYQPLAAYTNGLLLIAITVGVVIEAARRLMSVPEVDGPLMLGVAFAGGVANFGAFLVLSGSSSLNERGARAHVMSDLLGSLAAMIGATLIILFHWYPADPLLSLLVSLLIFRSGWHLTQDAAQVLLEGTPRGFDAAAVERELAGLPNVRSIHHIHAWSLTGETPIVTLHADCDNGADRRLVLETLTGTLRRRFGVEHVTVQIEDGECVDTALVGDCHESRAAP